MNQINNLDARAWQPAIPVGESPLYLRVADALQSAISTQQLREGARLPTQRALAERLGIAVGTANSAYLEAERRGLIRRHVGQGTFVATNAGRGPATQGRIDLSLNQPPLQVAAPLVRKLFAGLVEDADAAQLMGYPTRREAGRYRQAAALWLVRSTALPRLQADELLPSQGATQALLAVLDSVLEPGAKVLCEAITYAGFKVAVRQLGGEPEPVAIDAEGMVPDALEERARATGARAVLVCPTLQNPTGAIASAQRRQALADVARRNQLWLIEDDVYGSLPEAGQRPAPIAALLPDRVFYVGSASKAIAPGLRAGWVIPPAAMKERVAAALSARNAFASPFGCPQMMAGSSPFGWLAFAKLCETRLADEIVTLIRREASARLDLARQLLGDRLQAPGGRQSLHVWMPLAAEQAESLHMALSRQEIHLTPPSAPMLAQPPSGLRLCLGSPDTRDALEQALSVIAGELRQLQTGGAYWQP
jgi:DNA-binding transcriptional MocR family regulator